MKRNNMRLLELNVFVSLLVCTLVSSCTEHDKNVTTIRVSKAIDVGNERMDDFLEITHLIPIREPNMLIGNFDAIRLHDSLIYVMDKMQNKIHILNINGTRYSEINKIGSGPDEYSKIDDFDIDKEGNILIFCSSQKKILQYTNRGQFLSQISVCSGTKITALSDKRIAVYRNIHSDTIVEIFDPAKKIRQGFVWTDSRPNALLQNGGNILETSEGIFVTNPFDYSLYQVSENGFEEKLRFDFADLNLPEEFKYEKDLRKILKMIQKNDKMLYLNNVNLHKDWCIMRNHSNDILFFNRNSFDLYLFSQLRSPLRQLLANPIHVHADGCIIASVSSGNIQNALIPTLSIHLNNYPFLDVLNSSEIEEYMENDWLVIGKIKI